MVIPLHKKDQQQQQQQQEEDLRAAALVAAKRSTGSGSGLVNAVMGAKRCL
jgi:hypothetical protein